MNRLMILAALCWMPLAAANEVRLLECEPMAGRDGEVVIRGAIESDLPGHMWVDVYFEFKLPDGKNLEKADGKPLLEKWGRIFTPADRPVRWTDFRIGLALSDLEKCRNLPRGARTPISVTCEVWDPSGDGKWVSRGWDQRSWIIVTTNDRGAITGYEVFYTKGEPLLDAGNSTLKTRLHTPAFKHLKPREGVQFHRAMGIRHWPDDFVVQGERIAMLESDARGQFFEPLTDKAQALELIQLAFPQSVIIADKAQYDAIIAEFRKIPDWKAEDFLEKPLPPGFGVEVKEEGELGWRISMLMLDYTDLYNLGYRSISYRTFSIGRDGRMSRKGVTCLFAPRNPVGGPPGMGPEFGNPPVGAPAVPNMSAAIGAHNAAIKAALRNDNTVLPTLLKLSADKAEMPAPRGYYPGNYLDDYDRWPEDAGRW